MGLKEDLETMQRHERNGTLREYLKGDAPRLDSNLDPLPPHPRGLTEAEEKDKGS